MHHGSRNETISYYPAICLTESEDAAAAYGDHVHTVDVDRSKLSILVVEMTDEELRQAIDNQEWPCDRDADIAAAIAAGYDAVAYQDVDEMGRTHDCLRILTAEAWDSACTI